jgi:hypothetical protein
MAQPGRVGDLEQPHELEFQEREWRVGRAVWALIFAIVAATAAGLFGSGPLSSVTSQSPDGGLRVRSQRFMRYGAALRLVIDTRADADGGVVLRISRDYLRAMRVERILPEPDRTQQDRDGLIFTFSGNAPGAPIQVIADLQPASRGRVAGQIASGGARVDMTHFVYP